MHFITLQRNHSVHSEIQEGWIAVAISCCFDNLSREVHPRWRFYARSGWSQLSCPTQYATWGCHFYAVIFQSFSTPDQKVGTSLVALPCQWLELGATQAHWLIPLWFARKFMPRLFHTISILEISGILEEILKSKPCR